jgi:hypothetical protein
LDFDCRTLAFHGLLRRGLKIARFFRSLAHHLDSFRQVLLLVVVRVA